MGFSIIVSANEHEKLFPDFPSDNYNFTEVKYNNCSIFKPRDRFHHALKQSLQIIHSPESIIGSLNISSSEVHYLLDDNSGISVSTRACQAYLELLETVVTGHVYGSADLSVTPGMGYHKKNQKLKTQPYNEKQRAGGLDWPYLAVTMTGGTRILKLKELLIDVFTKNIPGAFLESGVWRGGSSIFARGVIRAYGEGARPSYVCDSFSGLPAGGNLHGGDRGWDGTTYLEVSDFQVARNFAAMSLLDSNVIFVKGFFKDTMSVLKNQVTTFSILRLDGDMYQSTVDVLYNLYDKLSVGGYLIMDDWFGFPSKDACEDFFRVHKMKVEIIRIDQLSAYWKKTEQVEVQYWRYEQSKFK